MSTSLPTAPAASVDVARARLRAHGLYRAIRTPQALRTFVEHHVVCVLDFMSLLKSLQRDLTCVRVPWTPAADPESARLIHEIVRDEESDRRADGRAQSHFAWYLEAMEEVGADTGPVRALVRALDDGRPFDRALSASALPPAAVAFGRATAAVLERPLHERAAAFLYGREEVIPEMFLPLVEHLSAEGLPCTALREYLLRHVQVDGGEHGPAAARMLARVCGEDPVRRREALDVACASLAARERLWDAIVAAVV